MRANVNSGHRNAVHGQLCSQPVVNVFKILRLHFARRDTPLVGNDDNFEPCAIEGCNRLQGIGQEFHFLPAGDIITLGRFANNHSITIKKRREHLDLNLGDLALSVCFMQGQNSRLLSLHLTLHGDSRTCLWTGAEALDKGLCLVEIVSVKSSRHINGGNRPSPLIQFPQALFLFVTAQAAQVRKVF